MAARWSEKNPNLKDAALEDAMQKQQWDPSVKGLTSVPQVLAMMNEKLDWTNQLGEAFRTGAQRYTECGSSTAQTGRGDR